MSRRKSTFDQPHSGEGCRETSGAALLSPAQAAVRLGIRTTTLYGWLGLARIGALVLRGEHFNLVFYQTGARGQGRILISDTEVERLLDHLSVRPRLVILRKPPVKRASFPGIHVPLGRPDGGR